MRTFNYESTDLSISHNSSNRTLPFVPHTHKSWELIFVTSGDLNYIVGNKIYQVCSDTLLITRPGIIHSISFNTPEPYVRYRLYLNEAIVPEAILKEVPADLDVIEFKGNTLFSNLFEKMHFYNDELSADMAEILLKNTIMEIFCHIVYSAQSIMRTKSLTKHPTIMKATEYINAHITEHLNVDDVAAQLFITRSHLYHLFVKHLNTPPRKYIMDKKLLLAQRDLRIGYKPIEVSARYGFSDYSTFYRDYKIKFGYSPSKENKVVLYRNVEQ